jgi:methionyl-tRNA formyltransferase
LSNDPSSLKLGFAGTPDFAVPALQRLAGLHPICAVFTQPDRPAGRGQTLKISPVKRCALELGLPVYQPATLKTTETLEIFRSMQMDALVVAAYGLILPAPVLALPRLGCINIHASLLPRWRGAAPIQRALLAGDSSTGVTIMRMDRGLDTGPMLASMATAIGPRDTGGSLHDRLALLGAQLIGETLDALRRGTAREEAQPTEGVTYAAKLGKAEAMIHWTQDAAHIWRQIRAFNPWPVAETLLNGRQLRIFDAELLEFPPRGAPAPGAPGSVLAAADEGIDVACGQGAVRLLRLQLAGRKPMAAREFLQGQRLKLARFADT